MKSIITVSRILTLFLTPFVSLCDVSAQSDSTRLKKAIEQVLLENGYKNAKFEIKVNSNNQTGGQTAFQINNYYSSPPKPPVKAEVIRILNEINPEILVKYKLGARQICVMISQEKSTQLKAIKKELLEQAILDIRYEGSESSSNTNTIKNCINDVEDEKLTGYYLFFLNQFPPLR